MLHWNNLNNSEITAQDSRTNENKIGTFFKFSSKTEGISLKLNACEFTLSKKRQTVYQYYGKIHTTLLTLLSFKPHVKCLSSCLFLEYITVMPNAVNLTVINRRVNHICHFERCGILYYHQTRFLYYNHWHKRNHKKAFGFTQTDRQTESMTYNVPSIANLAMQ